MTVSWITHVYHTILEDVRVADPRNKDLPLMQSIIPVFVIIAVYLAFALKWGPKIMEHHRPFELKNTLLVYNAVSVVVSVWMTYEWLANGWWNDYNFRCQLVDYSDSPKPVKMARLTYIYFICKLVELLDTVFFVLRKKNNQVTVLHVHHHTVMIYCTYLTTKFVPGGNMTFGILINCFVHSIMYTYYLLAGLGPKYQKYLWWKSHITKIQLIQFVVIISHQLQIFFTDCQYPKTIPVLQIFNVFVFFLLFLSFYKRSYTKPARKSAKRARKDN